MTARVSQNQIWSFTIAKCSLKLWKLSLSAEIRVYLYFNVNLFSSEEDKYNFPTVLKGTGTHLVLVLMVVSLNAAWCWCRLLCSVPFSEFFSRAGYSLGGLSVRKMGGWWIKSDKCKAESWSWCPQVSTVMIGAGVDAASHRSGPAL